MLREHVATDKGDWFPAESRFSLGSRKKFFSERVVRLLRHVVDTPSLEVSEARLAGAVSNMV